jgi:hypothetical protein
MKTLLLSALALAVVAAPVFGEDQDEHKQPKKQAPAQRQVNQVPKSYTPKVQQQMTARTQAVLQNRPNVNRTYTPQTNTSRTYTPNFQNRTRTYTPADRDASVNGNAKLNDPNWNRYRNRPNPNVVQTPNTNVQSNTNTTVRNRDWQNRTNTNRNWQNYSRSNTFTYQQARSRFDRQHHDRRWWRSHFSRIALFAGGYYYWNDGYWYPAYGYDPYYSTYTYDEPIYGYNDLDPGQVIANVQSALQEQGYYNGEVDGLIGPNTRAALSNFQRDNGLPVTAAIDGPTLQALGLY